MKTNKYLKKSLAMLIALMMLVSLMSIGALAANEELEDGEAVTTEAVVDEENGDDEGAVTTENGVSAEEKAAAEQGAAEALYRIGLFRGVGDDENGQPDFDLESDSTRLQGIIMLVRLLGAEDEALSGDYESPFTDVPEWAQGYVDYAYEMGWTKGVSEELGIFDPSGDITATQFLTFMLRALGYVDGVDFVWNAAWELSDDLGITNGEYGPDNNTLIRGEMAHISLIVLTQEIKGTSQTLITSLIVQGVFDRLAEEGRITDEAVLAALEDGDYDLFGELILEDVYDAAGLDVPADTGTEDSGTGTGTTGTTTGTNDFVPVPLGLRVTGLTVDYPTETDATGATIVVATPSSLYIIGSIRGHSMNDSVKVSLYAGRSTDGVALITVDTRGERQEDTGATERTLRMFAFSIADILEAAKLSNLSPGQYQLVVHTSAGTPLRTAPITVTAPSDNGTTGDGTGGPSGP